MVLGAQQMVKSLQWVSEAYSSLYDGTTSHHQWPLDEPEKQDLQDCL